MSFRGALIALIVLGGCYSPSISTCSLACADNNVCPNGFECSSGRCAIEGTNCLTSDGGGDDGMEPDNNTSGCGDGVSMPGEVCFKPAIQITVSPTTILDAQLVDYDNDGARDLVFMDMNGFVFRRNSGAMFTTASTAGPAIPTATRFLGVDVDGTAQPELIANNPVIGQIEIRKYIGTGWTIIGMATSQATNANGLDIGRVNATTGPSSVVAVFDDRLRVFTLPMSGQPLMPGTNAPVIQNGRDVAVLDIDNDNVGEIAVASQLGVQFFRGTNGAPTQFPNGTLIGTLVHAVARCDIDGDNDGDLIYSIGSVTANDLGRLGSIRWLGGVNPFEVPTPSMIPRQFFAVDCADIDRDMKGDVIAAAGDGSGNVDILVLRGKADGTLEAPSRFRIPSPVTHIHAKADYSGDGVPDIVITSAAMGVVTILESNP